MGKPSSNKPKKKLSTRPAPVVKRATLKDIAASLELSAITVSNILKQNPKAKYRQKTIDRVKAKAAQLGYQANRSAQAIRQGKTGIIGYVGKNANQREKIHDFVALPFITGLSQFLIAQSKHVGLVEMQELATVEPKTLPPVLQEHFFDGLVVGHGLSKELVKMIASSGVPSIFFDCGVFESTNCIYRDEKYATRTALDKLLSAGHRKIAFRWSKASWDTVDPDKHKHYSFSSREKNYEKYMRKHDLSPVILRGASIDVLVNEIRHCGCTAILLDSHCPFLDGALYALDYRTPQDISVASVACETNLPIIDQCVSGMGINRLAAGRQAAEMICQLVDNPTDPQPSIALKSSWEERGTISSPRLNKRRSRS